MDEPQDEHIFCEYCCDYVYEYCSIHGPLYVVPDTQPPTKVNFHRYVPRAALTIPREFLHIARSTIAGAGLGVFATLTLPKGVRFGPYQGQHTNEVNSLFCWQIFDLENKRPLHFMDAEDSTQSNWMRYVNCARHWTEQNLVAFQYQGDIYYKTMKIVPRFSELLVYYGTEYASYLGIDLKNYNSHVPYPKSGPPLLIDYNDNVPNERKLINNNNTLVPANKENFTGLNQTGLHYDTFDNSQIICNECNKGIESKTSLIKHLKTHENYVSSITYNTNIAHGTVSTNYPIKKQSEHTNPDSQQIDQSKPHVCSICKKTYSLKKSLTRHMKNHLAKEPSTCLICLKNWPGKRELRNHILNVHVLLKSRSLNCKGLDNVSIIRDQVIKHHAKECKKISCPVCSKQYSSSWRVKEHVKTIHAQERSVFLCPVCSKQFHTKRGMKQHMDTIHVEERKKFSCSVDNCSKQFYTKWGMKQHMDMIHVEERKMFPCPICQKQYSSSSRVKEHVKNIHAQQRKVFLCPVCNKQFGSKRGMKQHMDTIHVEERKMFPCPICRKQYDTKRGMKKHMKTIHIEY